MNRKQLISKTVRAIVFLLSVLVLAGYVEKAEAVTYYVVPSGNDSLLNHGTMASPFATIQHAINMATSGDAVNVAAGVYSENIVMKTSVSVIGEDPAYTSIVGTASTNGVALFDSVRNAVLTGFRITVGVPNQGYDRGVVFQGTTDNTAVIQNCIITNVQYGIFVWIPDALAPAPTPTIQNNTLVANSDEQGIYIGNYPTAPVIRNNIITGYSYAGIHVIAGTTTPTPIIGYNDVFNNGWDINSQPDRGNYANYTSQTGTNGNISVDPLFVDPANGDFHLIYNPLSISSPCIDAGNPASQYNDYDGTINDMGAFGGSCTFLSPASQQVIAAGGTGFGFDVLTSLQGCFWTANSNSSWTLNVNGNIPGETGNGTVTYDVSSNSGGVRQGLINIGGQTFTVTQNAATYTLSVFKTGTGTGTVRSNETTAPKINCGSTCSATYIAGEYVTLNAVADSNSAFAGWAGAGCSGTGSCTFAMNSNNVVIATFTKTKFTVTPVFDQHGTMNPSTPQVINSGQTVPFNITPNSGYRILSISGSCGGTLSENVYTTNPVTADCYVRAFFAGNILRVTASAGQGGRVSPTSATVNYGEAAQFTVTPDDGYHIALVSGCGVRKDEGGVIAAKKKKKIKSSAAGELYVTGPITADCTVSASFAINTFTVTPIAGDHGSMNPATLQTVNYNDTVSFGIAASDGYHIESVSGCGGTVYAASVKKKKKKKLAMLSEMTYTTGKVTGDCSVTASFAINRFTVTAQAGDHGSIDPSGPQTVNYNDTVSFTVTPDTGCHIASVSGCGARLSDGNIYATDPITGDCTVEAEFAKDTFTATVLKSGTGNGTITGSGMTCDGNTCEGIYETGSKLTLRIKPDVGSKIIDVKINGKSIGAIQTITLKEIIGNFTVEIIFGPA